MQHYVNGFMVTDLNPTVSFGLFILKNRPAFQAGKWNGIGGKVEADEQIYNAMAREFREETGIHTVPENWLHCVTLYASDAVVHFFRSVQAESVLFSAKTMEDEQVRVLRIKDILTQSYSTLPNMQWILPLCLNHQIEFPIEIPLLSDNQYQYVTPVALPVLTH